MALAGRSRRGGGRKWIIVGLVVTCLVLLIDASIKSRSPGPAQELSGQVWTDRVLPMIESSNVQAEEFRGIRSSGTLTATTLRSDLSTLVSAASTTYTAYLRLRAPTGLQNAAALLQTALSTREQAAVSLQAALGAELAGTTGSASSSTTDAQAADIAAVVARLQIADAAYTTFVRTVPAAVGGRLPASAWIGPQTPSNLTATSLQVWLAALQNRVSLASVHAIEIVALSTSPGPFSTSGGVERLHAGPLTVNVVVGNTGTGRETDLRVGAEVSAATGPREVTQTIPSLASGADVTIQLGPLTPAVGRPLTLIVSVGPIGSSATKSEGRTIRLTMPGPDTATTTTTPPTTVPTTSGTSPTTSGAPKVTTVPTTG